MLAALLLGAVAVFADAAAAAPLGKPDLELLHCVEPVVLPKAVSDAKQASFVNRTGLIHELTLDGDYARGLIQARIDVAQEFYREHADEVDFLVVFTTFEYPTGDALAFYHSIRNDVEGIGGDLFDLSGAFGSAGQLQGYVDMAAASRYDLNTRNSGFGFAQNVLAHELMHRWGVRVDYLTSNGDHSSDLLGLEGSHWSLLADTSASVMYGGNWHEEAPGQFRLVEARQRFSPWDLYLAGFSSASEVAPMRLLRGSSLDPTALPSVGEQTAAQPELISIEQVIAAEGERRPSATQSQRAFRAALLLLRRPDETVDSALQVQIQRFALAFESYFQSITVGRASLRFVAAASSSAAPGEPQPLVGSSPTVHADPLLAGLNWLKSRQSGLGGWQDRSASLVRDTTAAMLALAQIEPGYPGLQAGDAFLASQPASNLDELARLALAAVAGTAPPDLSGDAAGLGLLPHWHASPLDSALALWVDAERDWLMPGARAALLAYATQAQLSSGGFGVATGGPGRLRSSLYASRALLATGNESSTLEAGHRARDWLDSRLRNAPLQGPLAPPASELAEALALAGPIGLPNDLREQLLAALLSRQGAEGDWDGSVHTTAAALLAIALQTQPNFVAAATAAAPARPVLGEPVRLSVRVGNNGGQATPVSTLRWYRDAAPDQGGAPLDDTSAVPALLSGEYRWLVLDLESETLLGSERFFAALDPENEVVEASEADNVAELELAVLPRPDGVDIGLYEGDVQLSPSQFDRIGQRIEVSGQVRNLGTAAAPGAVLRLERIRGSVRSLLATTTLDFPAASAMPFELDFEVAELGEHTLELSIDPDGLIADSRRDNNVLALHLGFGEGVDFVVDASSIEWTPIAPVLGNDVLLRVRMENPGSSDSPATELALLLEADGDWNTLQRLPLSVAAGGQTQVEFVWRPQREGPHRLRLHADPDGLVAELDEDNNIAEVQIDVGRSDVADLVVLPGSIELDPLPLLQGGPLQANARVRNIGAAATGAFNVALYLGDPRSGGQRLAVQRLEAGLATQEEAIVELSVPDFPSRGDVSLFVLADSELEVSEDNEDNNFGVREATALGLPDLEVTSASLQLEPEAPVPGLPLRVAVSVVNVGEQDSTPVLVHLFERAGAQQRAVGPPVTLQALAPGAGGVASFEFEFGDWGQIDALYVQVDPEQSLREAARQNNETSLLLAVQEGAGFAIPHYFSPNGDGIKDRTAVYFAMRLDQVQRVEVRDAQDRLVVDLTDQAQAQGERLVVQWDGLDARGRLAWDGVYGISAQSSDGQGIGPVRVVLDTDRPPALEAVNSEQALQRSLPESLNSWLPATSASSVEDFFYARGNAENHLTMMQRGVVRTHALLGGLEPVLSARWLDQQAGGGAVEVLDVVLNRFDDGRLLVLLGNGGTVSLWVQDAGSSDDAEFVLDLPAEVDQPQIFGIFDAQRLLVGGSDAGAQRWIVDLATSSLRPLSQASQSLVMHVYPEGVLLGREGSYGEQLIPNRFVPLDATQPSWNLPISFDSSYDCFGRAHLLPDAPILLWHQQSAGFEEVRMLHLASRQSTLLAENWEAKGCQQESQSISNKLNENGSTGFASMRAFWLEQQGEALVLDFSGRQLARYSRDGGLLGELPIPAPLREGGYATFAEVDSPEVDLGQVASNSFACPGRIHDSWRELARRSQFQRRVFDASADRLFMPFGEVVFEPWEGGYDKGLAGSGNAVLCEGATDYLGISLRNEGAQSFGGVTHWPLSLAEDRQAYPSAVVEQGRVVAPANWPVFLHANGTHLRRDGRVARFDGGVGPAWAFAGRLLEAIHGDTRLELSAVNHPDRLGAVLSSLDRLRAELRVSSDGRSVRLSGIASDRHLDHFLIEYAHADAPDGWHLLQAPLREQVRLDDFLSWAPPAAGAYLFRLTVLDKAGNSRRSQASADVVFAAPIRDLRQDFRAISPNGDAVQDAVSLNFVVTRPTEQRFSVHDELGQVVFTEDRVYGEPELGPQSWTWDGRDDGGWFVPDGRYRIRLSAGFELPLWVDTVFPQVDALLHPVYPPPLRGLQYFADDHIGDVRGASLDISLQRRALGESNWTTWAEDLSRPPPGSTLEEWPGIGLSQAGYFAYQYRLVAIDGAGNRSVRTLPLPEPAFFLLRADEPPPLTPLVSRDSPSQWQSAPFSSSRIGQVPLHAKQVATGISPTVIAPGLSRPVFLMWSNPEAGEVLLDLARVPVAGTSEVSLDWRTVATGTPWRYQAHRYALGADFIDFELGEQVALRFRSPQEGALGLESNAFRFVVGGMRPSCLDLLQETINAEFLLHAPIHAPRLRLHYSDGSSPSAWLDPLTGSIDASAPLHDGGPRLIATFRVLDASRVDRVELSAVDGLGREHVGPVTPIEFCPVQFLPDATLSIVPVVSDTCDATPTGAVQARVELGETSRGQYRLELLDPRHNAPILIANGSADGPRTDTHLIDTREMAEGEAQLRLIVIPPAGTAKTIVQAFPVDHSPPQASILGPAPGARICLIPGAAGTQLLGEVSTDTRHEFLIEVSNGTAQNSHSEALHCSFGPAGRCSPSLEESDYAFTQRSLSGTLLDFAERHDIAPLGDGPATLRLRTSDWSGAQACALTQVDFDAGVDLAERRTPEPLLPGQGPQAMPVISWRGDQEHREARWYLRARETVDVVATLHPSEPLGSHAPGRYQIVGEALANLYDAQQPAGEIDLSWNAHLNGAPAPDGVYGLRIAARDSCGHEITIERFVRVDATPPDLSLAHPIAGASLSTVAVEIIGTVQDATPDSYTVQVSRHGADGPWLELASGRGNAASPALLGLWQTQGEEGLAWLRLAARDLVGNTAHSTVQIELLPRVPVLDSARLTRSLFSPNADGLLDDTEVQLVLRRAARIDIEVRDPGGALRTRLADSESRETGLAVFSWDGGAAGAALADGEYLIWVRATDAGDPSNIDELELSVVLDTQAPEWQLLLPEGEYENCDGFVAIEVDDLHLLEYDAALRSEAGQTLRAAGGMASETVLLGELAGLAEGDYEIFAEAQDRAGNRSELRHDFRLDCTSPLIEIHTPEEGAVLARAEGRSTPIVISADDENFASLRLEVFTEGVVGEAILLAESVQALAQSTLLDWAPELADGDYLLRLSAHDRADNQAEQAIAVRVDGTPPLARIRYPQDGDLITWEVNVRADASDANFAEYRLLAATPGSAANGEWTLLHRGEGPLDNSLLPQTSLELDGEIVLRLEVEDLAGLQSFDQIQLRVDRLPPPAPIGLVAILESGADVRLTWQGGEAPDLAGFDVFRLPDDWNPLNPQPLPQRVHLDRDVAEGEWRYFVVARDHAGNRSEPSNIASVRVDRTPPDTRLQRPRDGERVRGSVAIAGTAHSDDDFERFDLRALLLDSSGEFMLRESTLPLRDQILTTWDTRALAEETLVRLQLRAWDHSGNLGQAHVDVVVDNQPPRAPTGLFAVEAGEDVQVGWDPNSEADLLGYLLYRNGSLLSHSGNLPEDLRPLAQAENARLDPDAPDGELTYRVYAIDLAGNVSLPSLPAVLQRETGPPSLEIVRPADGQVFEQPIEILAESEDRDIASVAFAYRAAGTPEWTALGAALTAPPWRQVLDPDGFEYGDYEVTAVATDQLGQSDPEAPQVRLQYADLTPPTRPTGVLARAEGDSVRVVWNANDEQDLAGYRVERQAADGSWSALQSWPQPANELIDSERPQGAHRYRVVALDESDNESPPSSVDEAVVFAIAIEPQPYTPTAEDHVALRGSSPRAGAALLRHQWDGGEQSLQPGTVVAGTAFDFAGLLLQPGSNDFALAVLDGLGNRSLEAELRVTRGLRPVAVPGLDGSVDADHVSLTWQVPEGEAVAGYRIYRNGLPLHLDEAWSQIVGATSAGQPVPQVLDGDPETAWTLQAADLSDTLHGALRIEWESEDLVGGVRLQWRDAASSARDFDLVGWFDGRWNLLAEVRNQGASEYLLVLGDAYPTTALRLVPRRAQAFGAEHALTGIEVLQRAPQQPTALIDVVADGRHRYEVAALSPLGFEGPLSAAWFADVGDVEAPQPVVLSGSLDGRDAQLQWTASPAVDLARYVLLRNGATIAEVAADQARVYTDAALANGSHSYVVLAEDLAGNVSEPSNAVLLEVIGSLPGVPQFTQAVMHAQQPALYLHWLPGQGAPAVRFRLFASHEREGIADPYRELARPTASPWLHAGLQYGERLFYRIQAEDAFGNLSALSVPFEAEVRDVSTPPAPRLTWPTVPGSPLLWDDERYDVCGVAEAGLSLRIYVNDSLRRTLPAPLNAIELTPHTLAGALYGAALSPDGRLLYWSDDENGASAVPLDEPDEYWNPPSRELESLRFDRDGRSLYGLNRYWGRIYEWEAEGWSPQEVGLGVESIEAFAMRPDAQRWLLTGSRLGQDGLWLVDRVSGQVQAVDLPEPERVRDMAWHSQLDAVYLLLDDGSLWRSEGEGSVPTMLASGEDGIRFDASPREDAVLLVVADPSGDRLLLARPGLPPTAVLQSGSRIDDVRFAPDGNEFALLLPDRIERRSLLDAALVETLVLPAAAERGRRLQWTASWRLLVEWPGTSEALRLFDPSGAFCARDLATLAGSNIVEADARRDNGATSLRSLPIELLANESTVRLPDLAITPQDIRFLPATGAPGQNYSAIIAVRNLGSDTARDAEVDALLVQPDGSTRSFQRDQWVWAGQTHVLSLPLGVLTQEGEYHLHVALDPLDLIEEVSELNNTAEQRLRLSSDPAPQLRLSVANPQVGPNGRFDGEVRVETIAPFEGRIQLHLVDSEGHPVADLANEATGPIGGAAFWTRSWSWLPQGVLAGGYRLEGVLLDRFDVQIASAQLSLTVAAEHALTLTLQPLRSSVVVGETVPVELGLDYLAGNALLSDGALHLSAIAPDGSEHSLWSSPTGLLMAGYSVRRTVSWPTPLAAEPGSWRLRLRFVADGVERELQRELLLQPEPPSDVLDGAITLQPGANLVLGVPGRLEYLVENLGQTTHAALELRLLVLSEGSATPLLIDEATMPLAPGGQLSRELALDALPQQPAAYLALLQARRNGEWQTLAQRGFAAVDGVPPDIFLLAPDATRPHRSPSAIEVEAYDLHSRVDRVELSLDGGAWQTLAASGNRFHAVLQSLADGQHALRLRGRDVWGNQRDSGPHGFVVDNIPPQIVIDGVADGEHYNAAVVPMVEMTDAHPELLSVWLNGQPFESGSEVGEEGVYQLLAIAIDAAGNRSERELQFQIDLTTPELQIIDPANGAVLTDESVLVHVQTEAFAEVQIASAGWSASAAADAEGMIVFPAVPLSIGENRIQASATDRAGNASAPAFVDVTRLAYGGQVSGTLMTPGSSLARGMSLDLGVQVHNGRSQAVDGQLQLRVLAAGGEELHAVSEPLQLAPDQPYQQDHALATAAWPLGPLLVELVLEEAGESLMLDTVGIDLVDASAPQLIALAPAPDALLPGAVDLALQVIDDEAVTLAEYRIDAGGWLPLQREAQSDVFIASVNLADGSHHVSYRAQDAAGNLAQVAPIAFVVDTTPPQILVEGVIDGVLYGEAVTPLVSMLDAHPGQLILQLNGQPFASGQSIALSGTYTLQVTATDLAGHSSERSLSFELDLEPPVVQLTAPLEGALLAAPQTQVVGATKPGALVRVTGPASSHQTTTDLQGQFSIAAVTLVEGENLLVVVATDALQRDSEPVERVVYHSPEATQGLSGSLRAQPEQVPAGSAFELLVAVEEELGVARQNLALRLTVARGASTLAVREWQTGLAPHTVHEAAESFSGLASVLGLYQASLEVQLDGSWQLLAQTEFVVVDQQGPELAWLQPTADSFHAGPVPVRLQAVDDLGQVTRVQVRVAAGAWIELQPVAGSSEDWGGSLAIAQEGDMMLQARAYDDAQNASEVVTRRVMIDRTPPTIHVAGVVDGEVRNHAAQVTITVQDASPTQSQALLNGEPFTSGQSIEAHGLYGLIATAEDAARNRSSVELNFEIDLVPPELIIVAPQADSVLQSEQVDVLGRSEAMALIELEVGTHRRSSAADANGQFRFDGVPLQLGANLIRARATDRAGNTGAWAEVAIERRGGFAVVGSLEVPATLNVGAILQARIRVENQAEHDVAGLGLRLVASTSQGFERQLDARESDLAGQGVLEYEVSASTWGWPEGHVSLRLLASEQAEVQLATASVELQGGNQAPVITEPNMIPVLGPLPLILLVLLMLFAARHRAARGAEWRA